MGLLKPDGGRPETRQKVGYMPELPRFLGHLKGRELFDIYGRIYGMTESARKNRYPGFSKWSASREGEPHRQVQQGHAAEAGNCAGAAQRHGAGDPGRTQPRSGSHRHGGGKRSCQGNCMTGHDHLHVSASSERGGTDMRSCNHY